MVANNSFLLDTHIFIWWMEGGKKLSPKVQAILQDSEKQIFLSVISIWEMVIKSDKKQLQLPNDIKGGIRESGFILLPVSFSHTLALEGLPLLHKDPFDRMLIAQAKVENLALITVDEKIKRYDVAVV